MTIAALIALLQAQEDKSQHLVFSDVRFGDFDLIGSTGAYLSKDNFQKDRRLKKRED